VWQFSGRLCEERVTGIDKDQVKDRFEEVERKIKDVAGNEKLERYALEAGRGASRR
jgi:hypothetical protein